jgi:hypothetical protein
MFIKTQQQQSRSITTGRSLTKVSILALVIALSGCSQFNDSEEASIATAADAADIDPNSLTTTDPKGRNRNSSAGPNTKPVSTGSTPAPVIAGATGPSTPISAPATNLAVKILEAMPGETLQAIKNPIMFVTQAPMRNEFASRMGTFGNHLNDPDRAPRGGDLMIRYADGTLRNLTKEAGFGSDTFQGANAIAVREPTVHWSGTKAIFSMIVGAPTKLYEVSVSPWQIYEITGLGKGEKAVITKVVNQPTQYNNVSPLYGSDDKVIFTSDRPRNGAAHLYPQLDEYESSPTNTGLWSLDPKTSTLKMLVHTVSGAFSPTLDSAGRIIYTRWDHLLQDQQADIDRSNPSNPRFGAFNYTSELANAAKVQAAIETFPESRAPSNSVYGPVEGLRFNQFTPWQVNEDGTDEETLNHIGRQEFNSAFVPRTFLSDPALADSVTTVKGANSFYVSGTGGIFQMREDPTRPGRFFGIYAPEFASLSSGVLMAMEGTSGLNAENVSFNPVSPIAAGSPHPVGGRFRNPLPLSDGQIVATYTPTNDVFGGGGSIVALDMRLRQLVRDKSTGQYNVMSTLTGTGITKNLSWFDSTGLKNATITLWELEPVEVVARNRPVPKPKALEAPEKQVFAEEGVDPAALQAWLKKNDLALIVTRNQTSRDISDRQQPYNLQVPGGTKTVAPTGGKVYDIAHFQVFQADQTRAYKNIPEGRRPIATPLHSLDDKNLPNPGGPLGSVKIAADGSTAVVVPAQRALAWQTTDAAGNAVVRERVWVSMQSGEIRVCASCHGVNSKDQAGNAAPVNRPEALRNLLKLWKTLPK